MTTHTQKGFTLYELLVTVLIVGVVLAFGVPNFTAFTQNSRMATSVNDLLGSFQVARSEAARTKNIVSLCASANATSPDASCGGTFEDGWIVFQDPNGDVQRQAGEPLVRAHPPINELISINTAGDGSYFSYGPTALGRGQVGGLPPPTTTAVFCDERGNEPTTGGNSTARALRVLPIGRATVVRTVAGVALAGGCP